MICLGISNAGQILVSQAIGSGKRDRITPISSTLFFILTVIAAFFTVTIILLQYQIADLLNVPEEAYEMTADYLWICAAGMFFTAGYNMVSAVLRGMGDSRRPLLFIVIDPVYYEAIARRLY